MTKQKTNEIINLEGLDKLNLLNKEGKELLSKLKEEQEAEEPKFERYMHKSITFKKGLRASVQVNIRFDQKLGTYMLEVNGCQENSDIGIPNWEVEEFTCKNKECECRMYYNKETKLLECDRCDYTQELK